MQPRGSLSSQIGPMLRVGIDSMATCRVGRISTSSPLASTGIMHGSPISDDSSQHSDSGMLLKENTSSGVISYTNRSRSADNALHSQCILAMSTMAEDPSPRIAKLGKKILSIISIEQVVLRTEKYSISTHQGKLSAPSAPSSLAGSPSSSWFDMIAGHLPMTFRTSPVSPPRKNYLTGLRRVCSLEFRAHQLNSPNSGLADLLLSSVGSSGASESSLPQSTIYNWSCSHFSRPLLTAADENEEIMVRREDREKIALDLTAKCQRFSVSKVEKNKIASWDTKFETGTKAILLLPFSPIVVAADENERIRVWNYEEATPLDAFDNHTLSDRGISKLCLVNELDDSLLLVASCDGNVRIWKDYTQMGKRKLVTAFSSTQGHRPGVRSLHAVVDWQQQSHCLYASGDVSSILVWDLDKEQNVCSISSSSESSISALSASQVHGGQFTAGFLDGSVRIYDVRTPDLPIYSARLHTQRVEKVVGIGFQPGLDPTKIVSASQAGDIQFLDVRNPTEAYLTINAHRDSLTALAIHRHAPVIASGSAKQIVNVFNLEGTELSIINYNPTFMGQKIGPVSCLSFHPYRVLLAAGAADAYVTFYADDSYQAG